MVANDGIVYAGTGKGLGAYEARTGKQLWKNEDWGQGEGTTTTLTQGNGLLIGSAQWRALYGNDAKTGKKLWEASDNGLRNRGSSVACMVRCCILSPTNLSLFSKQLPER
mgnify:CR=1 FL=1